MNLSLTDDDSSNDIRVDSDEILMDVDAEEKDDVAIITPDSDIDLDRPAVIRADDFDAIRDLVLPPLELQPPIIKDERHLWEIEDWSALPRRGNGPVWEAGGVPWRILMFPSGNNSDNASLYLEHGYEEGKVPDDFVCCIQFSIVLWNPEDPEVYTHHTAHHRFTKEEGDWGFTRFVELRKLRNTPMDGHGRFLMPASRRMNITTYIRLVEDETGVLWHNFNGYDSKKETGFVGLKNQGATCYLNSLIQSLYFTNAFRKAVYQIPTSEEESHSNSAYTLQRLFYQLQTSKGAVSTSELTKSFGWETRHIFEQQDVQELSRKLMEKMEEKMKGTVAENVLPRLFCGKVRTYISCINVPYESRRVEDFWDIQLNVTGMQGLVNSFKDYTEVEVMNGENQYFAGDEHKLQDAKKGVIFESFPEVLHLQLKRFQYDVDKDAMTKINDLYEFPETFDAAPFLSDEADLSEPWVYQLHGVLVHSGDLNAGHYYAFIKPTKDGWFYKYDDDRVTKATLREVQAESFGGIWTNPRGEPMLNAKNQRIPKVMNAYMLVYIRQSRLDSVLLPLAEADTPSHLQKKIDEETAFREARKKERDEQHMYLGIKIITDETFQAYGGCDLTDFTADPNRDPAAPRFYRTLRKDTMLDLAARVAKDMGVEASHLRFWAMVNRQNKTIRVDAPISDPNVTVEEVHARGSKYTELRLWCEKTDQVSANGEPFWPTLPPVVNGNAASPKNDLIVLFLKHFDVDKQTLTGAGHIYISREKKVDDLAPAIFRKMGWPEKTATGEKRQLKLYEEIKPTMIDPMKGKQTLKGAELQDGDIVCFQQLEKISDTKSSDSGAAVEIESVQANNIFQLDHVDDARQFYDFLYYKQKVDFCPHPTRNANASELPAFPLILNKKHSYDQVTARIGHKLGVDSTHLRLWSVNNTTNQPKTAVKRTASQNLQSMLTPAYTTYSNTQRSDALFYEVLDISLSELDTKKAMKIIWLSEGITKETEYDLLVPKIGTVQDIVDALIKKAQIDDEVKGGPIRLYEFHNHKYQKEPLRENTISTISDYHFLVCERIPEEEIAPEAGTFIYAYHFHGEPSKAHSIPFKFLIKPDEPFSETRKRLEKRTGMKGKNFEKVKFATVKRSMYATPSYLSDEDVLYDLVDPDSDSLGLDHIDRSRNLKNGAVDLFLK